MQPQHLHQLRDPQTDSNKTLYRSFLQRLFQLLYGNIADFLAFSHRPQMLLQEVQPTLVVERDEKLKNPSGPILSSV